ncbi:alpha/beta fold hydrolase [Croceitalea rosinachiae]|uniref:Alpha/beta hydrolase n=1 Tax=Croceitalea rosinachiae TaxID=3075596 RepID=A0ABU3ADW4_9FLAO|nr:alpha/beta hydrolase [Croceitalea sp. F388]MDT0607985.1 alpha/beta hydrolase [Croceitalea sp. F388]
MKKILTKIIPLAYGKLFNFRVFFDPRGTAIKAFDIFCTIRKGKVLPIQKDFLDAAKNEVEKVNEHLVQSYRWKGNGDTVLLMHGWESNTYRWRNLIKKLIEYNFNIIAFDAPAHGYSTGKRLHVPLYSISSRHMLDKYQPKYVVAHSVGGMTILYDHFKNPKSSVEKIVTIGSPCEFSQFMDQYQGLLKFNSKVRMAMDKRLKEWLNFHFHEFSSARFVAHNTKKGLLFHDEEDLQVPFTASKNVHEHWKGSELIATKGLGHSMHQESVNDQIIEFLT